MWTRREFFHVPEEDEPCAIWLPLLHTDQWRTLSILIIYYMWILIKKNAKAHSSSHLISLWYQLIFCKDFKKTWKKKKQKTFFATILYFTKYFRCFLQVFFGDEFRRLCVDVLWTLFMFLLCEICSVVLFLSGLDLTYYVCIISSWEVFILKRHDIGLTRNGADVFICWFDDCLSNITWNKTMSTRSGVFSC